MKHKALFEELLHAPQMFSKDPHKFWSKFSFPTHYKVHGLESKWDGISSLEGWNKELNVEMNQKNKYWVLDLCPYFYTVFGKNTEKISFTDRILGRKKELSSWRWNPKSEDYDKTDDGSFYYRFKVPDEYKFIDIMDTEVNENKNYTNSYLNGWFNTMVTAHMILCVLLEYPSLTHETNVVGKKPAVYPLAKKTNYSSMRERPAWEHKVLEIDLYGEKEASANGVANGGSPKAFHSVRKHLRRLPDGKKIFVKAHFRGSRQIGVINKEYKFKERKNA